MSLSSVPGLLQPPLAARNGHTLQALGIARISTEHQDKLSLADQQALYRQWLGQHSNFPFELTMIAGRGSGECLERKESLQATAEVETGTYDLVIAEDLGRIFRRVHAQLFCELCEDVGTRLIAINDHVDTGTDEWRLHAFFATMRHEMYNVDTAKRIRRSHRNRFMEGGVVQTTVFGYIKPPGCKTDGELRKDPGAQPIYDEMFRRLEDGASYSEIADWLGEQKVPLPPYARSCRWRCSLVTQLIHNPILKGVRVRNKKISKRVNQTGRHKSVHAPPSERLERHCPHLAFIEPERYDRLIQILDERNAKFKRKGFNGVDTRMNVPKKRTIWPGQHIDCGICGRQYVYGGHGQKDHLVCRGALEYRCWNGITVDGPLAAHKLTDAILAEIAALPDFDPQLVQLIQQETDQRHGIRDQQQRELTRQITANARELENLVAAVRDNGHSQVLLDELNRLEKRKRQISLEQTNLVKASDKAVLLPSAGEIRQLAQKAFAKLAVTSPEFGRLMRRLIPRMVVYPLRLCEGGHPVLRARFILSLAPLLPALPALQQLTFALQRPLVVDLFEPPQREAYRMPVIELTANGLKQRDIAWELEITQTAVQRAAALSRRMEALGISDPYLPLTAPPDDYDRLRRHQHPRFRFERLAGEEAQQKPSA